MVMPFRSNASSDTADPVLAHTAMVSVTFNAVITGVMLGDNLAGSDITAALVLVAKSIVPCYYNSTNHVCVNHRDLPVPDSVGGLNAQRSNCDWVAAT